MLFWGDKSVYKNSKHRVKNRHTHSTRLCGSHYMGSCGAQVKCNITCNITQCTGTTNQSKVRKKLLQEMCLGLFLLLLVEQIWEMFKKKVTPARAAALDSQQPLFFLVLLGIRRRMRREEGDAFCLCGRLIEHGLLLFFISTTFLDTYLEITSSSSRRYFLLLRIAKPDWASELS